MTIERLALWVAAVVAVAVIALFAMNLYHAYVADPDADPGIIFERQNRPKYSLRDKHSETAATVDVARVAAYP